MSQSLDEAFITASQYLQAAVDDLATAKELADKGELNSALVQINMAVGSRINHAEVELGGIVKKLEAKGGVYPPPQ